MTTTAPKRLKGEVGHQPVLDKGFVQLVEVMGRDQGVIDAARVAYGSVGDPEKDKKLIRYLLAHKHFTPFEHSVLKFHVKAPLFVARQWFRHRSSSYNEESQRYTFVKNQFYFPRKWRAQSKVNKQGSVIANLDHRGLTADLRKGCREQMARYDAAVVAGAAKEMARFHIPVNVYTQWFWTVNARNLMAFIELRSDSHAQWEMQQYSDALALFLKDSMPWTYDAFAGNLDKAKYAGLPRP